MLRQKSGTASAAGRCCSSFGNLEGTGSRPTTSELSLRRAESMSACTARHRRSRKGTQESAAEPTLRGTHRIPPGYLIESLSALPAVNLGTLEAGKLVLRLGFGII